MAQSIPTAPEKVTVHPSKSCVDHHVQAAVSFLLALKPEQRPATVEKLAGALSRRKCCRGKDYKSVPATCLAVALKDVLTEKHPAYPFILPFAAAAATMSSIAIDDGVKAAAARAACCLSNSVKFSEKSPLIPPAEFLCKQAYTASVIAPTDLVAELVARGLISMTASDGGAKVSAKVSYNEEDLGKVTKCASSKPAHPATWLAGLQGNHTAAKIFKVELAKNVGEVTAGHCAWQFTVPTRPFVLGSEMRALGSTLQCDFALVQKRQLLQVKMKSNLTRLTEEQLLKVLPFFIGPEPAFVVGQDIETATGDVIGKKGCVIKGFEERTQSCLTVALVGNHRRVVGWLRAARFPSTIDESSKTIDQQLQDVCKETADTLKSSIIKVIGEANEKRAIRAHAKQGRIAKVAFGRTFSTEYTNMKLDRQKEIATNKSKKKAHTEQLAAKEERQKKNWKKSHDKGPAFHGARHKAGESAVDKESSYMDALDLPAEDDDE